MSICIENPGSQTCLVWIDLSRVRENLLQASGTDEDVSHADVREWLFALGFEPQENTQMWFGTRRSLRHLAKDEILRVEQGA